MTAFHFGRLTRLVSPRFVRFLGGSAAGLSIDLTGFAVLTWIGFEPGVANVCSSFASISVVYALVTRYAFGAGAAARTYVLFVAWYSASILMFSTVIEVTSSVTGASPLVWKVASIPVSFALNYSFSGWLFGHASRRSGRTVLAPADDSV